MTKRNFSTKAIYDGLHIHEKVQTVCDKQYKWEQSSQRRGKNYCGI